MFTILLHFVLSDFLIKQAVRTVVRPPQYAPPLHVELNSHPEWPGDLDL